MSKKLSGKVAVVTGGSAGIGLATAKRFVEEGAKVFITGRRQNELDKAVAEIRGDVTAIRGDTSNLDDIQRIYEVVDNEAGRIDVLFVNAGFYEFGKFGEISEQHFDRTFNTNVKGLLFTVQEALPLLSKDASVILNGSIASLKGLPSFSVYAATKAAVRSFARSWILDLKDTGIRVNVLSPGHTETPGLASLWQEGTRERVVPTVPLARMGQPEDLAKAAVFLASDESSYVTGVELFVDGGAAQY